MQLTGKVDNESPSSSCSALPPSLAHSDCPRSFPENGSQWTLNFKCKQRQYYGALWSIQFIKIFLDAALESTREEFDSSRSLVNAAMNAGTKDEKQHNGEDSSSQDMETDNMKWGEAVSNNQLRKAARMLVGAPASLQYFGPISAHHLNALSSEAFKECISRLLLDRSFWLNCIPSSQIAWKDIFPVRSGVCSRLWPEEMCERYIEDLRENRAKRARYYRDLVKEGYLCEAGLHSLNVLAGVSFASSSSLVKEFQTEAGRAAAAEWGRLIDSYTLFLPDRTKYHELENLPQEVAIGEIVTECVRIIDNTSNFNLHKDFNPSEPFVKSFQVECVVDVGGGNGFLAAQIAEQLGCRGFVIDPYYPGHSVDCCPRLWPDTTNRARPSTLRRQVCNRKISLFRQTRWAEDIHVDPARCVLIAKHLCGTAVDECLRHLQQQGCLPRILVLVPCCFNKGNFSEYINPSFLSTVLSIHDGEAFDHLTRLTDWNESIHQRKEANEFTSGKGLRGGRRGGRKCVKQLIPFTEALAKSIEALINQGRMLWLKENGYQTALVEYVPSVVTPKNKCIVAYRS